MKMNSFNHVGNYKKEDFLVMGGGGRLSPPASGEPREWPEANERDITTYMGPFGHDSWVDNKKNSWSSPLPV